MFHQLIFPQFRHITDNFPQYANKIVEKEVFHNNAIIEYFISDFYVKKKLNNLIVAILNQFSSEKNRRSAY